MDNLTTIMEILAIGIMVVSCSGETKKGQGQQDEKQMAPGEHAAHCDLQLEATEPTEESIYNASGIWQNRYGEKMKLSNLGGKIQVVAMVYTHCEYACPRILADMKRIRDHLSREELRSTNFVIVSIDPERDMPERLRNFAEENELNDQNWTLLHGNQGDVLELAALLGVKYKRISDNDFIHSNIITLLNRQGEVVYQRIKLDDTPDSMVKSIRELISL